MEVLAKLNKKFTENLQSASPYVGTDLTDADLIARAIAEMGQILRDAGSLNPGQKEIATITNEVFADMVLSLYLCACGMDRPAQGVLRRALELGLAVVYLWDLPHEFWGWKSHDCDLNFGDMIEHISKDKYKSFLSSVNSTYSGNDIFDYSEARRLYRLLSNTVHGKLTTHAAQLSNRFQFDPDIWTEHCQLVRRVGKVVLESYLARFFEHSRELSRRIPAIAKL